MKLATSLHYVSAGETIDATLGACNRVLVLGRAKPCHARERNLGADAACPADVLVDHTSIDAALGHCGRVRKIAGDWIVERARQFGRSASTAKPAGPRSACSVLRRHGRSTCTCRTGSRMGLAGALGQGEGGSWHPGVHFPAGATDTPMERPPAALPIDLQQ
jgi:hypothetical protein